MSVRRNRKFGSTKIVRRAKAKAKRPSPLLVQNRLKWRSVISMVTFTLILRVSHIRSRTRIVRSRSSSDIVSKTDVQYAKTKHPVQSGCAASEYHYTHCVDDQTHTDSYRRNDNNSSSSNTGDFGDSSSSGNYRFVDDNEYGVCRQSDCDDFLFHPRITSSIESFPV